MPERPISFTDQMVRAIMDGRKTMTRRCPSVANTECGSWPARRWNDLDFTAGFVNHGLGLRSQDEQYLSIPTKDRDSAHRMFCRFAPGDTLWVRECWAHNTVDYEDCATLQEYEGGDDPSKVVFRSTVDKDEPGFPVALVKWKPPMFMPRWAARLFLEVKSVRPERVQDITDDDSRREGVTWHTVTAAETYRDGFSKLWDSINGKKIGKSWGDNPWCWVIEFARIT